MSSSRKKLEDDVINCRNGEVVEDMKHVNAEWKEKEGKEKENKARARNLVM